ncbi:MAG: hypothetical protein QOE03_1098 [Micromonosporaceae bacterium]|jgi:hypothetical protein|nr:hypothetical protein [Micromonosporaceae bacterium]
MICYLALVESLLAAESRYLTSRTIRPNNKRDQWPGRFRVHRPDRRRARSAILDRGTTAASAGRTVSGRYAVDTGEIVDVPGSGLGTLRGAPKEAQPRNGELEVLLAVAACTGGSANPVEVPSCP